MTKTQTNGNTSTIIGCVLMGLAVVVALVTVAIVVDNNNKSKKDVEEMSAGVTSHADPTLVIHDFNHMAGFFYCMWGVLYVEGVWVCGGGLSY